MTKKNKNNAKINDKAFFYILLFLALILSIGMVVKPFQNDTLYTIKIGKLIINNGIDMLDHFSFHNIMYTYPHWLYDVFIYSIFYIGGFNGIYISTIILNMILLYVIFMSTKKITNTYIAPFAVSIMTAIVMAQGFATARAQLVTYILFALEIFFIEMFIKYKNKKYLAGLFLISLLICNIHVAVWPFYFILYLPYIAEYIICYILKKRKKDSKLNTFISNKFDIKNDIPIKELLIIMILSLTTGLITPIKDTPYTYLYKTMIGNSQKYIAEHQVATLKKAIFTIIITIETLILGIISKIKLRDLFLLLGISLMAFMSVRHIALLSVVIPLCVARTYNYFVLDTLHIDLDQKIYKILRIKKITVLLFVVAIIFACFGLNKEIKKTYLDETFYPIKATKYIKNNLNTKKIRLFNEYNFGSYLLYNDIPVFIDSRADLYTKEFSGLDYDIFDDYSKIDEANDYEKLFNRYKITHILLYKNGDLYNALNQDNNYNQIYEDNNFILYERLT